MGTARTNSLVAIKCTANPSRALMPIVVAWKIWCSESNLGSEHFESTLALLESLHAGTGLARQLALYEFLCRELLPNKHLAIWDRGSMASGLEVRMPFLDVSIHDWSRSLPWDWLVRGAESKRILRTFYAYLLPDPIAEAIICRGKLAAPSALKFYPISLATACGFGDAMATLYDPPFPCLLSSPLVADAL